jgi:hypothetical protein
MSRELLQQALDALENAKIVMGNLTSNDCSDCMYIPVTKSIAALKAELVKPDPVVLFTDNEEGLCIQLACDGAYYWQNLSDFDSAKFFVDAYRGRK